MTDHNCHIGRIFPADKNDFILLKDEFLRYYNGKSFIMFVRLLEIALPEFEVEHCASDKYYYFRRK